MNLKNKMKKSGGFTLIEMLIVVAIIAILVAVSIPMVSSSINKAKFATDQANERAAKSAAMIEYMTNGETGTFYYDAINGNLKEDNKDGIKEYGQCKEHKDGIIKVVIGEDSSKELTLNLTWDVKGVSVNSHNKDN